MKKLSLLIFLPLCTQAMQSSKPLPDLTAMQHGPQIAQPNNINTEVFRNHMQQAKNMCDNIYPMIHNAALRHNGNGHHAFIQLTSIINQLVEDKKVADSLLLTGTRTDLALLHERCINLRRQLLRPARPNPKARRALNFDNDANNV